MKGRALTYSAAQLRFVERHCAMRRRALHAAFVDRFGRRDVSEDHLRSLCNRRGWGTGRIVRWTAKDERILRKLYPDTATAAIAERLGRPLARVYARAAHLGLRKSDAYRLSADSGCMRPGDQRGRSTQFRKGGPNWWKGKKRPYHPNNARTQFKKGDRKGRANEVYKPIGTERLAKGGYLSRKINDGMPLQRRWRLVHLLNWEALHGPVPAGMCLKNLDGNRLNTDPANWELVPRGLLPRLNGIHGHDYDHAPAALKPTIMAVAKLEHAAAEAAQRRRA